MRDLKEKLDQATRDEMTSLEIVQAFREGNHAKSQAHAAFPLELSCIKKRGPIHAWLI